MADEVKGAKTDGVAFNPISVESVGLDGLEKELKEIAAKGPTKKFDTPEEYYEAMKALKRLVKVAVEKGYASMATSGPAVGDSVIVRDKDGVHQYEIKGPSKSVNRRNMLTGEKQMAYSPTFVYGQNWGDVLQMATNGEQVFFLIKHYKDDAREVLTYAWNSNHGKMELARPVDTGSTSSAQAEQIEDLIVDEGKLKVLIKNKTTGVVTKTELKSGAGYFFY